MRAYFGVLCGLMMLVGSAAAQQAGFTGSTGGSTGSSGGGFTGSSGGGFTGSSGGGFTGSTGGGFTGSTGGGFTGSTGTTGGRTTTTGRTGTGTGTTQYGTTTFLGKHYGNPLAMGARMATATSTTGQASQGATPPTTNYGSLVFGQPVYTVPNTATVGTTGNRGTTLGGLSVGGQLGGQLGGQTGTTQGFRGANSAGMIRAPQYVTEAVFERIAPAPTMAVMRPELQEMLASSTRLPSGGTIQVVGEGEKVVLRGTVKTERERRIAEAMIRMTPGVREVANEIRSQERP